MKTILYATTNDHKLRIANILLKERQIVFEKMPSGVPDIPEVQSSSQEVVAMDKAQKYYELLRRPLVVMDFGFFVEGLKGFPGVYTRYAIETIGVEGLIALVRHLPDRRAYTERTIVFTDGSITKRFAYRCPGTLLLEKRGTNGRDYDALFEVAGTGKTLAEMTDNEKAQTSAHAWHELGAWLEEYYGN